MRVRQYPESAFEAVVMVASVVAEIVKRSGDG